ncbi:MAG: hypothetical protein V1736_03230 [Pseudomonadota bacterium]
MLKLEWQHVDLEHRIITLKDPKGGIDDKIPMNDLAYAVLSTHPKVEDSPMSFRVRTETGAMTSRTHPARSGNLQNCPRTSGHYMGYGTATLPCWHQAERLTSTPFPVC